jgi:hypothetical protein
MPRSLRVSTLRAWPGTRVSSWPYGLLMLMLMTVTCWKRMKGEARKMTIGLPVARDAT